MNEMNALNNALVDMIWFSLKKIFLFFWHQIYTCFYNKKKVLDTFFSLLLFFFFFSFLFTKTVTVTEFGSTFIDKWLEMCQNIWMNTFSKNLLTLKFIKCKKKWRKKTICCQWSRSVHSCVNMNISNIFRVVSLLILYCCFIFHRYLQIYIVPVVKFCSNNKKV